MIDKERFFRLIEQGPSEEWTGEDSMHLRAVLGQRQFLKAWQFIAAEVGTLGNQALELDFSRPESALVAAELKGMKRGIYACLDKFLDLALSDSLEEEEDGAGERQQFDL